MAGEFVPLVMIPRFTTYIGENTYKTVGMEVSEFDRFVLTVWRGPLIGSVAPGATLSIELESSDDNQNWFSFSGLSPITTAADATILDASLVRRYLRAKVTLTKDGDSNVALTCWAAGHLERRER